VRTASSVVDSTPEDSATTNFPDSGAATTRGRPEDSIANSNGGGGCRVEKYKISLRILKYKSEISEESAHICKIWVQT